MLFKSTKKVGDIKKMLSDKGGMLMEQPGMTEPIIMKYFHLMKKTYVGHWKWKLIGWSMQPFYNLIWIKSSL
jgi:hypothetical protein